MALSHKKYNPDLMYGATDEESSLAITEGAVLVGDSSGLGTELDASTDTQILVGNGTTITSVAVSGDASLSNAGALTVTGSNAAFDVGTTFSTSGTATLSGAGAVPITNAIAEWTTTGADAGTLADGAEGQHLFIVMVSDGGDGTLTPSNLAGGTTITFDAVGDAVHLLFTNSTWFIVGQNGVAVA